MFTAEYKLIRHPAQLQPDWFLFCLTTRERARCRRRKTSDVPSIPIPCVRRFTPVPAVMTFVLHVAASLRSDWPSLRRMIKQLKHSWTEVVLPSPPLMGHSHGGAGTLPNTAKVPWSNAPTPKCSGSLLALKPPPLRAHMLIVC